VDSRWCWLPGSLFLLWHLSLLNRCLLFYPLQLHVSWYFYNFQLLVDVFMLIFVAYLAMLSVAQTIEGWMVGWLMNNYWKGCGRKWLRSNLRYYPSICHQVAHGFWNKVQNLKGSLALGTWLHFTNAHLCIIYYNLKYFTPLIMISASVPIIRCRLPLCSDSSVMWLLFSPSWWP
jgi:hypothetical protein